MASTSFTESNWSNYFEVTSDNTLVANVNGDLVYSTNIHSSPPSGFWSTVASDGSDLRVVNSAGDTAYSFEIEEIDTNNNKLTVFWDSQNLQTGSKTTWRIYYGNGSATAPADGDTLGKHNVWDSNFWAVYHMNNDPGSSDILDSTSNGRDASVSSLDSNDLVSGQLGQGIDVENGAITISTTAVDGIASGSNPGDFSLLGWVNASGFVSAGAPALYSEGGSTDDSLSVGYDDSGNTYYNVDNADVSDSENSGTLVSTNTWHHRVFTMDSATPEAQGYIDASQEATLSAAGGETNQNEQTIGQRGDTTWDLNAVVDEVRLMKTHLSSGYVSTLYENQSNSSFWTVGSEQTVGGGGTSGSIVQTSNGIVQTSNGIVKTA